MNRNEAMDALDAAYRSESRKIYSRLVRSLGDFDVAEDALQDAVRAATEAWPRQGVPDNPVAWLYQTAKFRGIDILRRKCRLTSLTERQVVSCEDPHEVSDEMLRLIFTCCHPAISPDAQVAMTLREVCELTTEEIARAFLTPAPTIAQRIVRAKSKIRDAGIPFDIPAKADLADRLDSVLKTIYLAFNEGYSSSSGHDLLRTDLIKEAIRLARQLLALLPEPEVMGILALMLVHEARLCARVTPDGDIILLEDQDRSLWNQSLIGEANELARTAFRSGRFGPYTIQAAIALVHATAPTSADTDWEEIVGLYDLLVRMEPTAIVELNRAVAVAMKDGPLLGISLIDDLLVGGDLAGYHLAYVARGELYRRLGDVDHARADFQTAFNLARQEPEKRLIQKRLKDIS